MSRPILPTPADGSRTHYTVISHPMNMHDPNAKSALRDTKRQSVTGHSRPWGFPAVPQVLSTAEQEARPQVLGCQHGV